MDNEKLLQALSDMINNKLEPVYQRFDQMDNRLDRMDARLDQMDNRIDRIDVRLDQMENKLKIIEVKQKRMAEQLAEVQLSQQYFELSTNKKLAKLQDEMDAIVVVLKIDELISI